MISKNQGPAVVDVYREPGFSFKCQLTVVLGLTFCISQAMPSCFGDFNLSLRYKYLEKSLVSRGLLAPRNKALGIPEEGALGTRNMKLRTAVK